MSIEHIYRMYRVSAALFVTFSLTTCSCLSLSLFFFYRNVQAVKRRITTTSSMSPPPAKQAKHAPPKASSSAKKRYSEGTRYVFIYHTARSSANALITPLSRSVLTQIRHIVGSVDEEIRRSVAGVTGWQC